MQHRNWFTVDTGKRAARVRGLPLAQTMKELPANSMDAEAACIELTCEPMEGTRKDSQGLRAFRMTSVDNGSGCSDPEVLRSIGSSTSDLNARKRGRFGEGLINVLAICESAEIRTLRHRLVFDKQGCTITTLRQPVQGMIIDAIVRHPGEDYPSIEEYFSSFILDQHVRLTVNQRQVAARTAIKTIKDIKLPTVIYDADAHRVSRPVRATDVQILAKRGDVPTIYELGIPVDMAPWELPFDINVLQKTPLDVDRNMLPDKFKKSLITQLAGPMSDEYIEHINSSGTIPAEIRDEPENATRLSESAQRLLVRAVVGTEPENVVRRNPLDRDDRSESQELETKGYVPLNRRTLPAGVSELVKNTRTVADVHDAECKVHFHPRHSFPKETQRQRTCMNAFEKIASALLGKPIRCDRVCGGGAVAAYNDCVISLNIDQAFLWDDPLGEKTLGVILHECAHYRVSGHSREFEDEVARLGGRLARWVAENHDQWRELHARLYGGQS